MKQLLHQALFSQKTFCIIFFCKLKLCAQWYICTKHSAAIAQVSTCRRLPLLKAYKNKGAAVNTPPQQVKRHDMHLMHCYLAWCLPSTKLYPIRDKSINILWASSGFVKRSANISAVSFLYNFARPEVTTSCAHKKTSICLTRPRPCLDPIASPVVASMNPTIGIVSPSHVE